MPRDKLGSKPQLVRGQAHGFRSIRPAYAFHLKQDLARPYHRYPVVWRALAFAHTGFGRLLGHRLVREQADPNFAAALHEPGHSHAAGFNLPVGNPTWLHHLQPVITKGELASAPRLTAHATALL